MEPGFLGDPSVIESKEMLKKYVEGKLDKRTLKERQNYLYVLDINRLRQDVRLNSVSEYSFVCVDKSFFSEGFESTDKKSRPFV